jgi:dynein heavy chain
MHPNADITYRNREAQEVLATILDVQPRGAAGAGGITREEKVLLVTAKYLQELPEKWIPDKKQFAVHDRQMMAGGEKTAAQNQPQPLSIFAGQEIDRLSVTIRTIRTTCTDLKLAVAGTIIMSPQLQDALNSIYDGRVPTSWVAVSWPSPSLSTWFNEVKRRYVQLNTWCVSGRPQAYWLPGFFNPQGFLTGVCQEISRSKTNWPLDKVETRTEVRSYLWQGEADKEQLPESRAVLIYGLYLDGCSWNKSQRRMQEAAPRELFCELPVMVLSAGMIGDRDKPAAADPMAASSKKKEKPLQTYRCPVYKYPSRTDNNFIFDADLNCEEGDMHWRLRGIALLCTTE